MVFITFRRAHRCSVSRLGTAPSEAAVWLDLISPTVQEDKLVEQAGHHLLTVRYDEPRA